MHSYSRSEKHNPSYSVDEVPYFFVSKILELYLDRESQPWKPLKKLTAPLENPFKLIFAFN